MKLFPLLVTASCFIASTAMATSTISLTASHCKLTKLGYVKDFTPLNSYNIPDNISDSTPNPLKLIKRYQSITGLAPILAEFEGEKCVAIGPTPASATFSCGNYITAGLSGFALIDTASSGCSPSTPCYVFDAQKPLCA